MALQRLKEAAEKAKKELSSATTTNINLPFITATAEGPKHFDMNLTRAKFDELTHDLVEKTAIPVQNAMRDAGLTNADLGQVLLVGGSTRIPAVQDKVKQLTGKEPSKTLNRMSVLPSVHLSRVVNLQEMQVQVRSYFWM